MARQRRGKQGPEDLNEIAFRVTGQAVGEEPADSEDVEPRGRIGGLAGGPARAEKLSAEKRSEIARQAARARWGRTGCSDARTEEDRT